MSQKIKYFKDFSDSDMSQKENKKVEYFGDLKTEVTENENYREVLYTGNNLQLVKMNIKPGQEIGSEVHEDGDQFFFILTGEGKLVLDGNEFEFNPGDGMTISAGKEHNVINTSQTEELKCFTMYSPKEHPEGTIHQTKEDED